MARSLALTLNAESDGKCEVRDCQSTRMELWLTAKVFGHGKSGASITLASSQVRCAGFLFPPKCRRARGRPSDRAQLLLHAKGLRAFFRFGGQTLKGLRNFSVGNREKSASVVWRM